jgi:hypothetical protein
LSMITLSAALNLVSIVFVLCCCRCLLCKYYTMYIVICQPHSPVIRQRI